MSDMAGIWLVIMVQSSTLMEVPVEYSTKKPHKEIVMQNSVLDLNDSYVHMTA